MKTPIYLDYMATTPIDPAVVEKMQHCFTLEGNFANPGSHSHILGWQAKAAVEEATVKVAQLINAKEHEIIWTSGATEANNLALKGAAYFYRHKGNHIITCKTEHKSVIETCRFLEKEGFEVSYLDVMPTGLIDLTQLKDAIKKTTILISIMHVNNEMGIIQDINAIGKITREQGIVFHVDAVQAVGKIPIDVEQSQVDLMSLSAHKVYGPKGIGALYLRSVPRVRIKPQIHGGGQQGGLRSGTLPTHQIVGMGCAFQLAQQLMPTEITRIKTLREHFWQGLSTIEAVILNGDTQQGIPHNLNVCFKYVDAQALMMELNGLAVSNGSACNSIVTESSYVLRALGLNPLDAFSSIRFSLGRYTTLADIDLAVEAIKTAVAKLRSLSPLWDNYQSRHLYETT